MIYGIRSKNVANSYSYHKGSTTIIKQPIVLGKTDTELSDISKSVDESNFGFYDNKKYISNAIKLGRNPSYPADNISVIIPSKDPINDIWVSVFNTPETNITTTSGFSISVWAYLSDLLITNGASSCIWNRQNYFDADSIVNTHSRCLILVTSSGSVVGGMAGRNSTSTNVPSLQVATPANTFKVNTWHHIVYTYNGSFLNQLDFRNNNATNSYIRVYVDGVAYGTVNTHNTTIPSNGVSDVIQIAGQQMPNPPTLDIVGHAEFVLGGNNLTRRAKGNNEEVINTQVKGVMNGYVRNVCVFNRAINQSEVNMLYANNGNPIGIPNLIINLPLQENSLYKNGDRYELKGLLPVGAVAQMEWLERYASLIVPPNPLMRYELNDGMRIFARTDGFVPNIRSGLHIINDDTSLFHAIPLPITNLPSNNDFSISLSVSFDSNGITPISGKNCIIFAMGDSLSTLDVTRNNLYAEFIRDPMDLNVGKIRITTYNNGIPNSFVSINTIDYENVICSIFLNYDFTNSQLSLFINGKFDNSMTITLPDFNSLASKYFCISKQSALPCDLDYEIDFYVYSFLYTSKLLSYQEMSRFHNNGIPNVPIRTMGAKYEIESFNGILIQSQFQHGSFTDIGGLQLEMNVGGNSTIEGYANMEEISQYVIAISELQ